MSSDDGSKPHAGKGSITDSKGWDGKLRLDRKQVSSNPEGLSDPECSDEDAPPPEQIEADEGALTVCRSFIKANVLNLA
jgi:hypothetical protein